MHVGSELLLGANIYFVDPLVSLLMIKNNQIYCSLTVITLWFLSLPFWIRNYIYFLNKVGQEKNCGTLLIYSMVYENKNKTELVRYQHNNGEEFYWRGILLESGERPS